MNKILLTLCMIATLSFADFREVDTKELQAMIKKGVQVIDIRRAGEFKQTGIIKGAHMLTFFDNRDKYDVPAWMNEFVKIVKTREQPFVIYCAHANRTKVVGNFLSKDLKYKNVYDLRGGIAYGWIDKGLKTVRIK
ncbi:MAG TPA: rhodanese-like domain-containing protein [Arcobacter sp.]|nr:rhodanese-like domain-containing protein [Arcobacter sp.]HIP56294.1 rhodanese-like domain-containing protein [Arcobacter sp.]